MTREEILKKAGVQPDTFCPACWHHVKKILRVFESDSVITADLEELEVRAAAAGLAPTPEQIESALDIIGVEVTSGDTSASEELLRSVPVDKLKSFISHVEEVPRRNLKRFWLSWVCFEEDHRPVTYPPGIGVLGWWCTGTGGGGYTMVAAVQAVDEDDVKVIIKNDWPEFDGSWRFFEELPDEHWRPNSRFPLKDWMKERF